MRFTKGGKVEVLIKKEVPPGSCSMGSEALVERVPRNAIRPCPPVGSVESWAVGDVVEVFDVGSWKIAMVSKVLSWDYYLARLLGSHEEFKVHKSNIRVRQSWQDNEWFVLRKGQGSFEVVKRDKPSSLNCHHMTSEFPQFNTRRKMQTGNNCLAAQDNTCFQESHIVSSRTLKRFSPYFSSHIEANTKKVRGIQKEGEHRRLISESVSPLLEKGQSWRLACLASKGLKMMLGFAAFLWDYTIWLISGLLGTMDTRGANVKSVFETAGRSILI
ncbi:hypothetical protein I3842_07G222500 [Carya illinoinensis]|uniref:Agenet domain-containing protein n=1 Tax=Carya illinoinensis TaxID=32201 RepID=A0A922EQW7_CARIL|nr:hypothetical protein I3842_07G222500 [Carya illinoinensis]